VEIMEVGRLPLLEEIIKLPSPFFGNFLSEFLNISADWKPEFKLRDALKLAIKVMSKTMDSTTLNSEKRTKYCSLFNSVVDICYLTRDPKSSRVVFQELEPTTLDTIFKEVQAALAEDKDNK
jgi:hypothetical protein